MSASLCSVHGTSDSPVLRQQHPPPLGSLIPNLVLEYQKRFGILKEGIPTLNELINRIIKAASSPFFLISMMTIFRVAVVPAVVSKLVKKGFSVNIEEDAGALANFPNKTYEEAGAKVTSLKDTFQSGNALTIYFMLFVPIYNIIYFINTLFISDIILKVRPLIDKEVQNVRAEGTLISLLYPAQNQELIKKLSAKNVNAFGKFIIYNSVVLGKRGSVRDTKH